MGLAKAGLWEWVEGKCKELGYGKLTLTIIVHKGLPVQVDLEQVRESFREEEPKRKKEDLVL